MARNREFLMLAKPFNQKTNILGWFASEKLDGMRAFWDGGITRGRRKADIWWANHDRDIRDDVCTGLWSRYGNVIHAPDDWLDHLPPNVMLDGELWMGRGRFQETVSITKRSVNIEDWSEIRYMIFDKPSKDAFLIEGKIHNPNFKKVFPKNIVKTGGATPFMTVVSQLPDYENYVVRVVEQNRITDVTLVNNLLNQVVDNGGEGLIIRHPTSIWIPYRMSQVMKLKPWEDSEGTVVGYITGRIGVEGKLRGMLGALILDWNGKRLELSGFNDSERYLNEELSKWAWDNPETEFQQSLPQFPLGSKVTFKYRELTKDGIPKEARYWRKRESE